MPALNKALLKDLLGELPFTAEVYWRLRQGGRPTARNYSLAKLARHLPAWCEHAGHFRQSYANLLAGKRILIFGMLRYWVEHTALLATTLAGLGGKVSLAYLPYAGWKAPVSKFDARRQNAYIYSALKNASPLVEVVPFLLNGGSLPPDLEPVIAENAIRDTQYTQQVEEVDQDSPLFRLRLERDRQAAAAALAWMKLQRPDVVILPNGSILEFSAVYQAARHLDIRRVTFEFGEQRQRIWLAQNGEVMRQNTRRLWETRKDFPLNKSQWEQVRSLFAARQKASLWENFSRRWQGAPSLGGEQARAALGLDSRPMILLATNVIGDSLTLGRQVFSDSMTEWLEQSLRFFAGRADVQLVVRIHPGEMITKGPSVGELVGRVLPELPEHIHTVEAGDPINTYDLVSIADLGLVYTTTVGMEMAMSGVPVLVVGSTHYRGKGFTLDPQSWEAYFELLDLVIRRPQDYRLTQAQVDQAWNYAYRFFFEYPQLYPWHIVRLWEDVEKRPFERVLSVAGLREYGHTFRALAGEGELW